MPVHMGALKGLYPHHMGGVHLLGRPSLQVKALALSPHWRSASSCTVARGWELDSEFLSEA